MVVKQNPLHYSVSGQPPTGVGLDINLRLRSFDFNQQVTGGLNSALTINPNLFKPKKL